MHRQLMHNGTENCTHFGLLPGRPSFTGIFRNRVYVASMHHRIGVEFISPTKPGEKPTKQTGPAS